MPKAAPYRLTWIGEHRIYALREAHNNEQSLPVTPGSAEGFSWLSSIPSFTFTGQHGRLTVRHEVRGGAGAYWDAYRRHGNRKSVLEGKSGDLGGCRILQKKTACRGRTRHGQNATS